MKNLADLNLEVEQKSLTISDALNEAFLLGKDENSIEQLVKELYEITDNFPYIEYYSHENGDCFKIDNEYTQYAKDKIVLCKVSEGIKIALALAVKTIKNRKDNYFNENTSR